MIRQPDPYSTFNRHFHPCRQALYNYICKTLNFSPDSDDLFQETAVKAFKYFHTFHRDRNFKSWIFAIAHNLMKDHFRKQKNFRQDTETQLSSLPLAPEDPDIREIYRLAESMKPKYRDIFFLYYDQEFSILEISRITGLSIPAIKFRLYHSRKHIKKILEVSE